MPEPVTTPVKPANPFAGLLLAVMLALSIGGALFESLPMIAAASFAWLALIVCWQRLSRQQQLQALVLLVLGVMGLWWGVEHDVEIELPRAFEYRVEITGNFELRVPPDPQSTFRQ